MMVLTKQSPSLTTMSFLLLLLSKVDGVTVEDIRFATKRCQLESTTDQTLRIQWSMQMFPDNHATHCYVKCFLSKLGLIDLKYRGLDDSKLTEPLELRDIEVSEDCYTQLEPGLSGTCEAYYKKWMELRSNCKEIFTITLFEDLREMERSRVNNERQGKPLGESASEYCSRTVTEPESKELNSVQVNVNNILSVFKRELECSFQHIHYFDAYGRLDETEIWESFKEAKAQSDINFKIIKGCVHQGNAFFSKGTCEMAYELYQCLLKKLKNFKDIYLQRDAKSRLY